MVGGLHGMLLLSAKKIKISCLMGKLHTREQSFPIPLRYIDVLRRTHTTLDLKATIWQRSGYNPICVKQQILRKPRRAHKSSWSRRGNRKVIYTDNSLEFGKSCEELSWNHCTSTPHRSDTNGTAERAVRRVNEGICGAVSVQSGQ